MFCQLAYYPRILSYIWYHISLLSTNCLSLLSIPDYYCFWFFMLLLLTYYRVWWVGEWILDYFQLYLSYIIIKAKYTKYFTLLMNIIILAPSSWINVECLRFHILTGHYFTAYSWLLMGSYSQFNYHFQGINPNLSNICLLKCIKELILPNSLTRTQRM